MWLLVLCGISWSYSPTFFKIEFADGPIVNRDSVLAGMIYLYMFVIVAVSFSMSRNKEDIAPRIITLVKISQALTEMLP